MPLRQYNPMYYRAAQERSFTEIFNALVLRKHLPNSVAFTMPQVLSDKTRPYRFWNHWLHRIAEEQFHSVLSINLFHFFTVKSSRSCCISIVMGNDCFSGIDEPHAVILPRQLILLKNDWHSDENHSTFPSSWIKPNSESFFTIANHMVAALYCIGITKFLLDNCGVTKFKFATRPLWVQVQNQTVVKHSALKIILPIYFQTLLKQYLRKGRMASYIFFLKALFPYHQVVHLPCFDTTQPSLESEM